MPKKKIKITLKRRTDIFSILTSRIPHTYKHTHTLNKQKCLSIRRRYSIPFRKNSFPTLFRMQSKNFHYYIRVYGVFTLDI